MPGTDLALLLDAARAAGSIAMDHFGSAPQIWDKADNAGPVTEADFAVNTMLHDRLRSARPEYGWLSEESEDTTARQSTTHQFLIDPIDGTRAFIDGSRDWAHALAVVKAGQVISAVVYLPARDAMFHAEQNSGAFLNGERLNVTAPRPLGDATVLTTKPNLDPGLWADRSVPNFRRAFRSSLAYRLCLVAQGKYDAMMTLRPTWEWDVAAGSLIVSEAGGTATDRAGGDLLFNNPAAQVDGVIAGGGVAQALRNALA